MIGIKAGFLFFFPVVYSLSVSVIGDSLLASSSPIVPTLEKRSGLTFQNHALVGAGILNGWVESIPSQYDKLRPLLSDKTIFFLDGGGNDVMSHRGDCQVFNEACQNMFSFASSRMNETFHLMAKDGIASVYYLGFYCLPSYGRVIDEGTLLLERFVVKRPFLVILQMQGI